jgi:NitT/TauT family transport system substrate-binding protein
MVAISLAALALLAGCGSDNKSESNTGGSTSSAPKTTQVRAAFTPGFGTLPVHVAAEKGFFKKHGLDVQLTEGLELPTYIAGLGRRYELAMSTSPIFLAAVQRGLKVKAISNMQYSDPQHPNSVVASKKPIASFKTLEGQRVGVPTLTGTSAESLRYLVKADGGDPAKVKFVETPFATMGDQLKAGKVDAVVSAIPFYTVLKSQGYTIGPDVISKAVGKASDGATDSGTTAFFVSSDDYIQSNPDAIKAWRESLQEAIDYIDANEADARKILQTWLKLPAAVATSAPFPGLSVDLTGDDLAPFITISQDVGSLKGSPPDKNALVAAPSA